MALRTLYILCVGNTSLAQKATFACVYDLCALSGLFVRKRLLRINDLMRTYTTYALGVTYVYEVRLLRVTRLILQGLSWTCRRGDDSTAYPRCFFTLRWPLDGVLDDYSIVPICRPGGSVQRMRSSVFSLYLTIFWASWFVAPEDLSKGCDLPFFLRTDLDFWWGLPPRKMWSSVFSLPRSWLLIRPSFSFGIEASVVIFLRRWSVRFKTWPSPYDDYLLNPVY